MRSTLVQGATSLLFQVRLGKSKHATAWMQDMLERNPPKLVAIALANKIARIAWKLMLTGESYQNKAALPAMATAAKEISLQRCA